MNKIYTCGYSGHIPEQLKQAAETLDAFVVDVRMSPVSRMPEWNYEQLIGTFFDRYIYIQEFGNANYKTGPIELYKPAAGLLKVLKLLESKSVILLCGCREYSHCHRRVCAELFHERGIETHELEWPVLAPGVQSITVLSIRQPWAFLIANGLKDIENRNWRTNFRGEFFIHAGKSFDADGYRSLQEWCEPSVRLQIPNKNEFELGGIVGRARIVDCVDDSESDWFFGPYGFVIEDAQPLAFRPLRGQLGFFKVSF